MRQHWEMKTLRDKVPDVAPNCIPLSGENRVVQLIRTTPRIKKIDSKQSDSYDTVTRLRNSWLGRIYRGNLKRYAFVRWIVHWIWRNGYPFFVRHLSGRLFNWRGRRWYSLIKLSDFVQKNGMPTCKLAASTAVETPAPTVFPSHDQSLLVSPHDRYRFPEVFVAKLSNAMIYGGTNLLLVDDEIICHDLFDAERDYTSEELHGHTLIDMRSSRIRWLLHDRAPESIPVAATFIDACASNYAHWITEVLPRIAMFCAEDRFHGVPIVVNEGLHRNIMESLLLVVGNEHEIITLPIGRALAVYELYLTSVTGYVPFERRTTKLCGHSHGMFNPRAFELLRNKMGVFVGGDVGLCWPEKVFLRRKSGVRVLTNLAEIEQAMVSRGYVIVEPEKLSFLVQVQLFRNAKCIVGSSGAALANILFAQEDAKIFILISKHPDTSYWYWQNIACASGKKVHYVIGHIDNNDHMGIHADFKVDLENLMLAIGEEL